MRLLKIAAAMILLGAATSAAADLEYVIEGIDDPLRANVLAHIDVVQLGRQARVSNRDLEKILEETIGKARSALRPYGYYAPEISGRFYRTEDRKPVLELSIRRGPPVRVDTLVLDVTGPGATHEPLVEWRKQWPLGRGVRLNQVVWKQQKQRGLDIARGAGYLGARYSKAELALDLEDMTAAATLVLESGPRYRVGTLEFDQELLDPRVVRNLPRFDTGDPYSLDLLETFRQDLWRSGYFDEVDVKTRRKTEVDPPVVDITARLSSNAKNRYIGALGVGTDTGMRLQGTWTRQPVSRRGDRLEVGLGWQEIDEEFAIRTNYRLPRADRRQTFWVADLTINFENRDLEFKRSDEDESFIKLANGNIDERHLRLGSQRIFNRGIGETQTFVTTFAQFLNSERRFALLDPPPVVTGTQEMETFRRLLAGTDDAFSLGIFADAIDVRGSAFEARGRRDRGWVFTSSEAIGSEIDFTQLYLSTRRSYVFGDRLKLLLRAEVGYTDATIDELTVDVGGDPLVLSVTRLPSFYRFRAGGSASVRGYGFEQLSNNNVGSNHIATASAEIEYRYAEKWSVAAFADIGNAFNHWSDPALKRGIGLGIRWYSIAGPIRVDFARAEDFDGKPWRIHFTVGTPLL